MIFISPTLYIPFPNMRITCLALLNLTHPLSIFSNETLHPYLLFPNLTALPVLITATDGSPSLFHMNHIWHLRLARNVFFGWGSTALKWQKALMLFTVVASVPSSLVQRLIDFYCLSRATFCFSTGAIAEQTSWTRRN